MSVSDVEDDTYIPPSSSSVMDQLITTKSSLIEMCTSSSKPSLATIKSQVQTLEELAEQAGVGQASSHSGILKGEWECIYAPEDVTRSSPFFWAFRRAFPENSDQIFAITDGIPAPIKEVGPAYQTIDLDSTSGGGCTGTLVSRVKVATLGGLATSIMTTRCTITGAIGLDGLRLKVESTKPEDSTVLQKLGPLGEMINTSGPPFPSGEALERVMPGSSEVVMLTTYCDEGLRISKNEDRLGEDVFVWRRKSFGDSDFEI